MKTAELEALEQRADKLQQQRTSLLEELRPIQQKLTGVCTRLTKTLEKIDAEKVRRSKVAIDFNLILDGNPRSMPLHKERERQLGVLLLGSSGYYPETGQTAVRVALRYNDTERTRKQLASLELLLPNIKRHKDKAKHIELFDHNLHADGGWSLAVFSPKKVVLMNGRHDRQTFKSLADALAYCQQNHWYDGGPERDYDD